MGSHQVTFIAISAAQNWELTEGVAVKLSTGTMLMSRTMLAKPGA